MFMHKMIYTHANRKLVYINLGLLISSVVLFIIFGLLILYMKLEASIVFFILFDITVSCKFISHTKLEKLANDEVNL